MRDSFSSVGRNSRNRFPLRRLPLRWAAHLAALRLLTHWRSWSATVLGLLLVASIGASIPLYTAAVAQVGMIQRLHQQPAQNVSVYLQTSQSAARTEYLAATWAAQGAMLSDLVRQNFDDELPGWAAQLAETAESTPMQVVRDGEDLAARLRIAYYEGWERRLTLVDGSWPNGASKSSGEIEAALGVQAAERLGLRVDDAFVLEQRGWASSSPIQVRITGLVRAADDLNPPADVQQALRAGSRSGGSLEANLFTTREGFLLAATQYVPDAGSTFGWWLSFEHDALSFADVAHAVSAVNRFRQSLPQTPSFIVRTQIPAVLANYVDEVDVLGAPFGLILIQVGALALFFVIVTAALVRRAERREIAVLQSRGGADWQIALVDGIQMLLIGALTTVAAPFVARQCLAWVIPYLTEIERLQLALEGRVFAYAAAAVAVSLVVLTLSLIPILRLPLVHSGGAAVRSEQRMWWQRYYLDLVLLIVGIGATWRLVSRGTPLIQTQIGGLKADPLLLLAPVFLAIAVGSLVLRLFPTLSGWAAKATARWSRLESALAMWQVSRDAGHYGRLSFLLALAVGVGWLATSFHAALLRSQYDRAAYQVGADIRLVERDTQLQAERARPVRFYLDVPGVEAATDTSRFYLGNASGDPRQPMPGEILAVDPETFGRASYWRSDLGPRQTPPAYAELRSPGRALPFNPARIGVWLRLDQPARAWAYAPSVSDETVFEPNLDQLANLLTMSARLRDASALALDLPLTPQTRPDAPQGWLYFEGDLATLPYSLQGDVRLEMLQWSNSQPWQTRRGPTFRLHLADLTLIDADQSATGLDWLAAGDPWEFVQSPGDSLDGAIRTAAVPGWAASTPVLNVTWIQQQGNAHAAIVLDYPELGPIPVLASPEAAALNHLRPGTTFQVGMVAGSSPWFQLVDTVPYYPTLYSDSKLFLVAEQRSLLYALNRRPGSVLRPSEVWLRLHPHRSASQTLEALSAQSDQSVISQVQTIEQVRAALDADMLQSGLVGLLYLAFAVAMALSVVGQVSYMVLTIRQRRTDFGVLQAIGLSVRRLVTSIMLEQVIVMAIGLTLGVLLGAVMSDRVLPALALRTSGEAITPPFVIRIEVAALVQYGGLLLALLGLTVTFSLLLIRHLPLAELLRFGEE